MCVLFAKTIGHIIMIIVIIITTASIVIVTRRGGRRRRRRRVNALAVKLNPTRDRDDSAEWIETIKRFRYNNIYIYVYVIVYDTENASRFHIICSPHTSIHNICTNENVCDARARVCV